eukprot:755341-Alexandrium_andersonii.AAC.1
MRGHRHICFKWEDQQGTGWATLAWPKHQCELQVTVVGHCRRDRVQLMRAVMTASPKRVRARARGLSSGSFCAAARAELSLSLIHI